MMSIVYLFWMFVILFGIVGWMRGWAKELLVSFSVILALGLNHVLRRYIPIAQQLPETDESLFWVRTIILLVLIGFLAEVAERGRDCMNDRHRIFGRQIVELGPQPPELVTPPAPSECERHGRFGDCSILVRDQRDVLEEFIE